MKNPQKPAAKTPKRNMRSKWHKSKLKNAALKRFKPRCTRCCHSADLLDRIKTATEQRARQVILNDQWQSKMDAALGVRDSAHLFNLAQLMEVFSNEANAARMISELDGFIARRKAELENLEARIKDHAGKHSLEYLVPSDMGGKAPPAQ